MTDKEYLMKKVELLEKMVINLDKRVSILSEIIKRYDGIEECHNKQIDLCLETVIKHEKILDKLSVEN